jgi:hypothetical protein
MSRGEWRSPESDDNWYGENDPREYGGEEETEYIRFNEPPQQDPRTFRDERTARMLASSSKQRPSWGERRHNWRNKSLVAIAGAALVAGGVADHALFAGSSSQEAASPPEATAPVVPGQGSQEVAPPVAPDEGNSNEAPAPGGNNGENAGGGGKAAGSVMTKACSTTSPDAPVSGYKLAQCEDFNHGLGKYSPYDGGGGDTVVGKGRVPSQCKVSDSYLHLEQKSNGATCGGEFKPFAHRYGVWEVRMRAYPTSQKDGSEAHPVTILWPHPDKYSSELDFTETNIGKPEHGWLHCNGQSRVEKNCYHIPENDVDYSKWHTYDIVWKKNSIKGYIDGKKWWPNPNDPPDNKLDVNEVVPLQGSELTAQLDNLSGETPVQPAEMDVDYAKMFTK